MHPLDLIQVCWLGIYPFYPGEILEKFIKKRKAFYIFRVPWIGMFR
jgi:hypothetical protein